MSGPVVSVVVPTVNRPTLPAALASLAAQSDPRWEAVVVGDGCDPPPAADPRVRATRTPAPVRDAGPVRNAGLPLCRGAWVGFLDDDDELTPEYVADLAAAPAGVGAVLFRCRADGRDYPPPGVDRLGPGVGGIMFAVRRVFLDTTGLTFRPGPGEDTDLLTRVAAAGARVMVAPAVRYLVRPGRRVLCRACHGTDTGPVPFAAPPDAGEWHRCRACGSDTAAHAYDPGLYTPAYFGTHAGDSADPARMLEQVRSNCDWFGHHAKDLPNKDFLDVGCADGSALRTMQELGWAVHGFDVTPPPYGPAPHLTVGAVFTRWLFPLRYAAVLCREVVEHVDSPDLLLNELHGVACPGGLVQVQTPKPIDWYEPHLHQRAHLCLLSPARLRVVLAGAMLDVIDSREWDIGQAYLCRARS